MEEHEDEFEGLAVIGEALLGEQWQHWFEEQDDTVDSPVAAPKPGLLVVVGGLEGVVGEAQRDEEGEGQVDETGQHHSDI